MPCNFHFFDGALLANEEGARFARFDWREWMIFGIY